MERCAASFAGDNSEALAVATKAVKRYADHYGQDTFEVAAIEELLETEFFGWRYTARADLITRDRAGRIWIYDHKFVNRIELKVFRRYILSGQFLGLTHLGVKTYGEAFAGIRLNLVGCADGKFARTSPEPAPWMLERFGSIVRHAEEGIERLEKTIAEGEPAPAAPSEHTCWGSYGECPAFELCRWGGGSIVGDMEE